MRLSLCIAVYNEATNLHYALDSGVDWVDEVIVVDGGSTDGTLEKLSAYGSKVRIIHTDNPPMFHINKQKAIQAASGEWILQLDADEEVTPELRAEIQKIVDEDTKVPFAYQIPRLNYFLGRFLRKGGVYPDYTIRLYRHGSMYLPCRDVHENAEPVVSYVEQNQLGDIVAAGKYLGTMSEPMKHYSDPGFARYFARWKLYSRAEARLLRQNKVKTGLGFYLSYIFVKPCVWFFKSYFRHLGFMDSWQGLVFHFMSAIRYWSVVYYLISS